MDSLLWHFPLNLFLCLSGFGNQGRPIRFSLYIQCLSLVGWFCVALASPKKRAAPFLGWGECSRQGGPITTQSGP